MTVVGSEIDRKYFHDVKAWTMDNSTVLVVEDNVAEYEKIVLR